MGKDCIRIQLAAAVRSIQWSYAIFWSISPRKPRVLEWGDGYYNGDIKTMKKFHSIEVNSDPQGLQRSEQLRELFEHLSVGESLIQTTRSSVSLSPEDLCDTEWYYLVCMSFLFNFGQGLPGRTLAKGEPIWLLHADFADTKIFTRSLLAKSASIQTVVCFPFLEGVIELGVTELVKEDQNLIKLVKDSILDGLKSGNFVKGVDFEGLESKNELPCSSPDESFMIEERISQEQNFRVMDGDLSNCKQGSVASSDCMSETWATPIATVETVDVTLMESNPRLKKSSFATWKRGASGFLGSDGGNSQKVLKMILMEVPQMHKNGLSEIATMKTKELLATLRTTLPPSINYEDDKSSSIVNGTIKYLQQLERRIEELESCIRVDDSAGTTSDNCKNKRKANDMVEKTRDLLSCCVGVACCGENVEIEMECRWREGLLLDIIEALTCFRLDSHSVQSKVVDGILFVTVKSKVKNLSLDLSENIKQTLQRVAINS